MQDETSCSIWLWLQKFLYIGLGLHNLFGVRGCSSMRFVYTLIVIKLLFFACNENKRNMIALSSIGIIGVLLFNHTIGKGVSWAITNQKQVDIDNSQWKYYHIRISRTTINIIRIFYPHQQHLWRGDNNSN